MMSVYYVYMFRVIMSSLSTVTQKISPSRHRSTDRCGLPVPQQQFSDVLQGLICQPPRTPFRTTNQNIPSVNKHGY